MLELYPPPRREIVKEDGKVRAIHYSESGVRMPDPGRWR